MITSLFSKTIGLLAQALDVRSERHRVITANIANQDTPGYQAMEVNFKEALRSVSGAPLIRLDRTNPSHLSPSGSAPSAAHAAVSSGSAQRLDGNTVNGEQEMAKLAENTLFYEATTQILNTKFRGLRNAIKEGR